jgi:hypothetical protein
LSDNVHNILNHITGCHDRCDATWCNVKKAIDENVPYFPPTDHWLDKDKYPEAYQQLKDIINQYASVDMIR